MSAVDEILSYERSKDDDYYSLLNCDENSTAEQITAEYRALALQWHPDKVDGDKQEAEARFQKLQEAKDTLCDPAKKIIYDKWRNSGISIGYKQWLGMKDHVQQTMHWVTPKTKDRMIVGGAGGSGTLGTGPAAARRASEGGAAHWGRWAGQGQEPPSEVVSKFRNYEI